MAELFGSARAALEEYDIALDELRRRSEFEALLDEAHARIAQLEYLVTGVIARVEERFAITERPIKAQRILDAFAGATNQSSLPRLNFKDLWSTDELERRAALAFEAELFTESFYWVAWRLRNVIQFLPYLNNFDVVGTRDARNHLIEHPEKNLQLTPIRDLKFSRREGVVLLRSGASNSADEIDCGLVSNAEAFRDKLVAALGRARSCLSPDDR